MADYLKIARAALALSSTTEAVQVRTELDNNAEPPETASETPEARIARRLLNRAGVRIMVLETATTIGIWSDLDGPEIREALQTLGHEHLPVRYLDGAGIPAHYRLRRVEGEPVPANVVAEMERNTAEPWKVRDQVLTEIGWHPKGTPAAKVENRSPKASAPAARNKWKSHRTAEAALEREKEKPGPLSPPPAWLSQI
jgi:hypothetical protein